MLKVTKKFFALLCLLTIIGKQTFATERALESIRIVENFPVNISINNQILYLEDRPILIEDQVYVPVRVLADVFGAKDVSWDDETQSVMVRTEKASIKVTQDSKEVFINELTWTLEYPVISFNNRIYVPIRFFSHILGADEISWEDLTNTVAIVKQGITVPDYFLTQSKAEVVITYSEEDLYWLSRIVEAEAKGEPYEGKLAVANVVINRKNSSLFPNTIKEVIFDNAYGVQFTPTKNGAIYNTPSDESILAAKEALEGNNNIGDALYFVPASASNSWASRNRTYYMRIQGHNFYL